MKEVVIMPSGRKRPRTIGIKERNLKIANHPGVIRTKIKPGEVRNPKGRPKGSRNKLSEAFLRDFLGDWEKHGAKAIRLARKKDPVAYLRVAAGLLPKDFNLNVSSEAELEKVLEKFDDEQLEAIFTAISAAESTGKEGKVKKKIRTKSSSIH